MKNIYIVHSNGRPYFEAVELYAKKNDMNLIYIETNIIKQFIKIILGRKCFNCKIKDLIKNIKFFIQVPFVKNQIVIYGTAPYDFRFLWYSLLYKKNNFIYHTSHYRWENDEYAVFKYGLFNNYFKKRWFDILKKIKIVGVTKAVENSLKKVLKNDNIFQIYHTITFNRFYKERNFSNLKKIKILFVGRFVYEKGLDLILRLIEELDEEKYEFSFVGDGKYKKNIEYIFKKKNVNYLGWISDKNELAKIYQSHHILLNPSIKIKNWEELFGIVNIEAMASGMVVIASNHIGPKEIIKNGVNGFLFEDRNYKQLKNIILDLDKMTIEEISKNAINFVKEFDIENIANKWERVINE